MEPIDVYLMYCAMKAHFGNTDYDFITYKGKSRVSRDSFYKRKDRFFFVKLSRKYKIPCGIHIIEPKHNILKKYIKLGYQFLPYSADTILFNTALKKSFNKK